MKELCAASQTVGPFFRIGFEHLCPAPDAAAPPDALVVSGRVLDADQKPVPDAVLELWYADRDGLYSAAPPLGRALPQGFVRVATDDHGSFTFCLLKPGPVAAGDGRMQSPHVVILFFARGLLRHLITRMYFPAEPANDEDPVLQSVPVDRRATLIARPDPQKTGQLQWDIRLQGEEETVFFAW